MKLRPFATALACCSLMALAATPAQAQHHPRGPYGDPWRFDGRYHHDHDYPRPGYRVPVVPGGAVSINFHGGSFFFHGGVWYRPAGPRFVVVAPPVGIVLPLLPPSYVTLMIGGAPYYYANEVYYMAEPGGGYRVVPPPQEAESAKPAPVASPRPAPDPILYPRNGQSTEQTESDRRECNRWATTQPDAMNDASIFKRAVEACMDGRGYTVR